MPAKRKIFLTHAGELAYRLVRAVARDGLVAQFVRSYAQRYARWKLVADPQRMRELERTIGREALLLICVQVERLLPRLFAGGPGRALRPEESLLCEAFHAEFLASLERGMEWPLADAASESASFRRDLDMYRQWSKRAAQPIASAAPGSAHNPFPDRCAILLDPAMMEQARRAASEFEEELVREGKHILDRLGRGASPGSSKTLSRRKPHPSRKRVPARSRQKPSSRAGKRAVRRRPRPRRSRRSRRK